MAQLASHPGDARRTSVHDEDVRRAIEVLAAADERLIEQQVLAAHGYAAGFLFKVRKVDDAVATRDLAAAMAKLRSRVDPATARAAQATENVWREVAAQFGLLKSGEVGEFLGASKRNRGFVADRRDRGELLGVERNNGYLYPGFQFNRETGEPMSWVKPLLDVAAEHGQSATDVLFWMMSPSTYFNGDRPADHVDDGERLIDVARRAWDIQW